MKRVVQVLTAAAVMLLAFAGTAWAASAVTGDNTLLELLSPVIEAFRGGDYPMAGSAALVLVVALLRRYGTKIPKVGPYLGTPAGGAVMNLALAFGGTMVAMLSGPGAVFSMAMVWTASKLAIGAAGGYTLVKELVVPWLVKIRDVLPGWAKPLLDVVLWVFNSAGKDVIAGAEKAGNEAVDANPPGGADSIVGPPRDVN